MTAQRFRVTASGDDALCIHCGEGDIRHRLAAQLRQTGGWQEVVPGKRDVTVLLDPHAERMADALARLEKMLETQTPETSQQPKVHELGADFGGDAGPDLAVMAERLATSQAAIIEQIEQSALIVDMLGFTPGFAYLTGVTSGLVAERLATPRTRVAAGSIGLITGQIGLYALDGPGGWPIIGRVRSPLFDFQRASPFLLSPCDRVLLRKAAPA